MTNRKTVLLDRLAQYWKTGSQAKRKEMYDTIGRALQYLTILSPYRSCIAPLVPKLCVD
jgi:hypothetical protein